MFGSTKRSWPFAAAGEGFEPSIEVAPDAGFQDLVLVLETRLEEAVGYTGLLSATPQSRLASATRATAMKQARSANSGGS